MKVFVSGATGVIGRRVVALLLAAGHEVTGVARNNEKAAALGEAGADAVLVDLFDVTAVTAVAAGHDVLINLATHIPPSRDAAKSSAWAENDRIRNEVSANIAAAARANSAGRVIQESIILPYADGGDDWIREDCERSPAPRVESVEHAENNVSRATESGVTVVILRFGMFYAEDSAHTREQVDMARKGLAPVIGGPDGYISSIHADDAAGAVVAALKAPSGAYNVVDDDPVTRRVFAETISRAVHKKHSSFMFANMLRLAGESRTGGMARSLRVSNELFKDASGWTPRYESVTTGMPPVVEAILAQRAG